FCFFFQAEDGIRDFHVTGVQTCALPISARYFCPDSIRTNNVPPKVVLTELRILNQPIEVNQEINGREVLQRPLYLSSSIDLTHRSEERRVGKECRSQWWQWH